MVLFPDSNFAVVVLTNSIAINDAADCISRAIIQALFDLRDNNDYVKLAKEGNKRAIQSYEEMIKKRNKIRDILYARPSPNRLTFFVGKYKNPNKPFYIAV